ncbi:hypothetical protein [Streptomyces sp. SJL17-1]|uniref:hypothetical protein n=1 Tax=Streptomyces sp. SJL17-1 TaxID=2967223 RepID=UPI002967757D|nr:hypothetical protein [Streptomyces sp. SJL17-1]
MTTENAESQRLDDSFHVFDTTLRDGAQREGINLTVADKLTIARHLDEFGVGFIEGCCCAPRPRAGPAATTAPSPGGPSWRIARTAPTPTRPR